MQEANTLPISEQEASADQSPVPPPIDRLRGNVVATADIAHRQHRFVDLLDRNIGAVRKILDEAAEIVNLPLNGRNPTQLMRLVAGVQIDTRGDMTSGTTYPGVQAVSVNGGRGNTTTGPCCKIPA